MKIKKLKKKAIFVVALISSIIISSLNPSLIANAFWAGISHAGLLKQTSMISSIGSWQFDDVVKPPNGVIVVEKGESGPIPNNGVVYYDGDLLLMPNYPYNREVFGTGTILWNTAYFGWKWYNYMIYQTNQAVIYEGRAYIATSDGGNVAGINPKVGANWKPFGSLEWISGKIYKPGTIVEDNGELYNVDWEAKSDLRPSEHGPYGLFKKIQNTTFVNGATYGVDRIVRYNGGVYKAIQSTNAVPATPAGKSSWQRIDSLTWNINHAYKLHDVVEYGGHYYQVANEARANSSTPGSIQNAWNQIDTHNHVSTNIYKLNHLVIYNNYVYRSLRANNVEPVTNSNAWVLYQI